ncbi:MAG: hypothetical protein J5795_08625 [Lachnospiraceae bacterium]|nr:hypothetical protein [Lachnospiraceae bacterium]
MLYFCVALYPEAAPVLSSFGMKSAGGRIGSLYRSDEAILVLTGSGSVTASAALAEALTLFPPSANDLLINLGICGAPSGFCPAGSWFRIHKITDSATGRDFYPELLFTTSFPEAALTTTGVPASSPASLTDMEAAGIFLTGQSFFPPERMLFYKSVSDFGVAEGERLTPANVTALVERALPDILADAVVLRDSLSSAPVLSEASGQAVSEMVRRLDASAAMEHEIRLLASYRTFRQDDAAAKIMAFLAAVPEPVTRREGKKLLEQFRNECLA